MDRAAGAAVSSKAFSSRIAVGLRSSWPKGSGVLLRRRASGFVVRVACCVAEDAAGSELGGPVALKSWKGDEDVARGAWETRNGALGLGERAGACCAGHLPFNHKKDAPVTKNITPTKRRMRGRKRIGRLNLRQIGRAH